MPTIPHYGFNLGHLEGLDRNVSSMRLKILGTLGVYEYPLLYSYDQNRWTSTDENGDVQATLVNDELHIYWNVLDAQQLGEAYSVEITANTVSPTFSTAVNTVLMNTPMPIFDWNVVLNDQPEACYIVNGNNDDFPPEKWIVTVDDHTLNYVPDTPYPIFMYTDGNIGYAVQKPDAAGDWQLMVGDMSTQQIIPGSYHVKIFGQFADGGYTLKMNVIGSNIFYEWIRNT